MQVKIDRAADAALITWSDRKGGRSQVVDLPSGRTVRLLLSRDGDVAGLEVLGWSRRADKPFEVQVVLERTPAEKVAGDDPLAQALSARGLIATSADGRPVESGDVMIPMSEVSDRTGLERSWLTREASNGRLTAKKIGREWWTTEAWLKAYGEARAVRSRKRAAVGA